MSEDRYFITEAASKIVGKLWYVKESMPGSLAPVIICACFEAEKAELVKQALDCLSSHSGDKPKTSKIEPGGSRGK